MEKPGPSLSPRKPVPIRKHYFAFGSNMSLQQMTHRCPNSKFIGRATLRHYQWMINQRGFANVVPSKGDWVEGLIFEIDAEDERRLDKNEGVAKPCFIQGDSGPTAPCYRKAYRTLSIHRAQKALYRRPVSWIVEKGGPARVVAEAEKDGDSVRNLHSIMKDNVLVYLSPEFVGRGLPRAEYVKRINRGVYDARVLGITPDYIERFIRRCIPPDGQAGLKTKLYLLKQDVCVQQEQVREFNVERGAGRQRRTASRNTLVQDTTRDINHDRRPSTSLGRLSHSQSINRLVERQTREGRMATRSLSLSTPWSHERNCSVC